MKFKNFLIISSVLLFLFSCAHEKYNRQLLIGSWHWDVPVKSTKEIKSVAECVVTYKDDGRLSMSCSHDLIGSDWKVKYRVEDESEWLLSGDNYLEKTIRQDIVNIDGEEKMIQIVERIYTKNDINQWDKGKILKLNKNEFVIKFVDDDGTELIYKGKKIF